jgi:3-deoxy-D-manno-octulosonic-acid transferase
MHRLFQATYSLLVWLLCPLILLAFVWRFGLRRTFQGLPERFGWTRVPPSSGDARSRLWVHAASVGEVRAVEPLLRRLPQRFPDLACGLTTTTVTGQELARGLSIAQDVRLAPVDLAFAVKRLLKNWQPRALVLVETELWPNWIETAGRAGVPLVLVNGRISDRALPVYLKMRRLWGPLLGRFTWIGVQSPGQAERWLRLGADPAKVVVTGNLKFDAPVPDLRHRPSLFEKYGFSDQDKVWVCGSTHEGEESVLMDALVALRRRFGLKMVLAPRHGERVPAVARALLQKGLPFRLRSELSEPSTSPSSPVLVLDTVGELGEVFGVASAAFVGGSLVPRGGQNPLEPARWGVPVLFGPHMENFREPAELLLAAGGGVRVEDAAALERTLAAFYENPLDAARRGQAAKQVVESQRGAVERSLDLLARAVA